MRVESIREQSEVSMQHDVDPRKVLPDFSSFYYHVQYAGEGVNYHPTDRLQGCNQKCFAVDP